MPQNIRLHIELYVKIVTENSESPKGLEFSKLENSRQSLNAVIAELNGHVDDIENHPDTPSLDLSFEEFQFMVDDYLLMSMPSTNTYLRNPNQFLNKAWLYGVLEDGWKDEGAKNRNDHLVMPIKDNDDWELAKTKGIPTTKTVVIPPTPRRRSVRSKTKNPPPEPTTMEVETTRTMHLIVLITRQNKTGKKRTRVEALDDALTDNNKTITVKVLDITLCSPLQKKKENGAYQLRPKTGHAISFQLNIEDFILHYDDDDDEFCMRVTELRRTIMKEGIKNHVDYKNNISPASILYLNHVFNKHDWKEIVQRPVLHKYLGDLEFNKGKVSREGVLKLRASIGMQTRNCISDIHHEHLLSDSEDEDADDTPFVYSQTERPDILSPEKKLSSQQLREGRLNRNESIRRLILRHYTDPCSPLYHGFLHEHEQTMMRVVANFSKAKTLENHPRLLECLDSDSKLLSDGEAERYLVRPVLQLDQNSCGSNEPEKERYSPIPRSSNRPPRYVEWRRENPHLDGGDSNMCRPMDMFQQMMQRVGSHLGPPSGVSSGFVSPLPTGTESTTSTSSTPIETVTLSMDGDEYTIAICGGLSMDSTMEDILNSDEEFMEDTGWDPSTYKYKYKWMVNDSVSGFTYRNSVFCDLIFKDAMLLRGIKIPMFINIEKYGNV